jgi:hypothetical protein
VGRVAAETRDGKGGDRESKGPRDLVAGLNRRKRGRRARTTARDDRPVWSISLKTCLRGVGGWPTGDRPRVVGSDDRSMANVVRAALDQFGSGTIAHEI